MKSPVEIPLGYILDSAYKNTTRPGVGLTPERHFASIRDFILAGPWSANSGEACLRVRATTWLRVMHEDLEGDTMQYP
jgi:hypothetical protein